MSVRIFSTYEQALTTCYEEEVAGAAYFAALATRHCSTSRVALQRFAKIETITAAALLPLIIRHGFVSRGVSMLIQEGEAEALNYPITDWQDFLVSVVHDFPAFMPEFQQTISLAPPQDRILLQILVDHEIAFIDYAKSAMYQSPLAEDHLLNFIARYNKSI